MERDEYSGAGSAHTIDGQPKLPGGTLIWDRSGELEEPDVLYSFALEELLCRQTGEGAAPIVHLWRHPRGFVMGLRDSRLPGAQQAADWLAAQGYAVGVRNSGGAAVPLDPGVVNVSLILPKRQQGDIDFRDDFERMYLFIREALEDAGVAVDKGEIGGAYCPGDYDLSIGGRKFCGIAQRRQAHAYVVQAFVVAGGSGSARAELVREFYRLAAKGQDVDHPRVAAASMASLEELAAYGAGEAAAERFVRSVKWTAKRWIGEGAALPPVLPAREEVLRMADSLRKRYGIQNRQA